MRTVVGRRLPRLLRAAACALPLTLSITAGPAAAAGANPGGPLPIGAELPDVVLAGLNGPDRPLGFYRGRRLIINVWASWCGPCRAEAASLERLAWSAAGARVTIIGVSTDDERAAAQRWLSQSNATISHYLDRALVVEKMLGADRIPLTVLVDERGRIVARVQGARAWDDAEQRALIERAYGLPATPPAR